MVANVANWLPHFCVYGKANEHDSKKEDVLFESLKAGDIGILDRAYNKFETLYKQSERGVIFVVREKEPIGARPCYLSRTRRTHIAISVRADFGPCPDAERK